MGAGQVCNLLILHHWDKLTLWMDVSKENGLDMPDGKISKNATLVTKCIDLNVI